MAGCEAQGKAQGFPLRPGTTGEGKAGRVNASESSLMPRYGKLLERVLKYGGSGDQSAALHLGFGPIDGQRTTKYARLIFIQGGGAGITSGPVADQLESGCQTGRAGDLDLPVVLVAPDVFHGLIGTKIVVVEKVVSGASCLLDRICPVFDTHVLLVAAVVPTCDVPDCEHVLRTVRAGVLITEDAVVDLEPRASQPCDVGYRANANDYRCRSQTRAVAEFHPQVARAAVDLFDRHAEPRVNAMATMLHGQVAPDLGAHRTANRRFQRIDDGHLMSQ